MPRTYTHKPMYSYGPMTGPGQGSDILWEGALLYAIQDLTPPDSDSVHYQTATYDDTSNGIEQFLVEMPSQAAITEGARIVKNLVEGNSEDLENSAWSATAGTTIDDSDSVNWDASGSARLDNAYNLTVGNDYTFSALIWTDSGTHDLRFRAGVAKSSEFTATTTPTRFSGTITADATTPALQNGLAAESGVTHVSEFQIEDVTGRTNQDPQEYVSVGRPTGGPDISGDFDAATILGNGTLVTNPDGSYTVSSSSGFGGYRFKFLESSFIDYKSYVAVLNVTAAGGSYTTDICDTINFNFSDTGIKTIVGTAREYTGTYRFVDLTTTITGNEITFTFDSLSPIDHGLNVDGVKAFPYSNTCTVSSNVVTCGQTPDVDYRNMPELFTDGGFASDPGWTLDSDWTITGGQMVGVSSDGNLAVSTLDLNAVYGTSLTVGKQYAVVADVASVNTLAGNDVLVLVGGDSSGNYFDFTAAGVHRWIITATDSNTNILDVRFTGGSETADAITFNSISIKEVSPLKGLITAPAFSNYWASTTGDLNDMTQTRATIGGTGRQCPDGVSRPVELIEDGTAANSHITYDPVDVARPATTTMFEAVFVKRGVGSRNAALRTNTTPYGATYGVTIDLDDGTVGFSDTEPTAYGTKYFGDGWWLMWLSQATTAGGNNNSILNMADATMDLTYDGDSTSSVYFWGYHCGVGTYPSNYVLGDGSGITTHIALAPYTLPISTLSAEEGSCEFDIYLPAPRMGTNESLRIWGGHPSIASRGMYLSDAAGGFYQWLMFDSTGTFYSGGALPASFDDAGITMSVRAFWSAASGEWQVCCRLKGTDTVDTGALLSTFTSFDVSADVLYIGRTPVRTIGISNLKFYSASKGQAWTEAV